MEHDIPPEVSRSSRCFPGPDLSRFEPLIPHEIKHSCIHTRLFPHSGSLHQRLRCFCSGRINRVDTKFNIIVVHFSEVSALGKICLNNQILFSFKPRSHEDRSCKVDLCYQFLTLMVGNLTVVGCNHVYSLIGVRSSIVALVTDSADLSSPLRHQMLYLSSTIVTNAPFMALP